MIYHVKYERCDHGYVAETATPPGPPSARLKELQDNAPYSRRFKVHKATAHCCNNVSIQATNLVRKMLQERLRGAVMISDGHSSFLKDNSKGPHITIFNAVPDFQKLPNSSY